MQSSVFELTTVQSKWDAPSVAAKSPLMLSGKTIVTSMKS